MMLPWNIVAKNIHPHEQLQGKLREKIGKLERHLQHFPPDAVHLQVSLDRHPRKGVFTAALTLRLPSNVLHSTKTAADPIPALDNAVKALLRELASFKSELRREAVWKRQRRRGELPTGKATRFSETPLQAGQGPQSPRDLIRAALEDQYPRLLHHVRSEVHRLESDGTIPQHSVDAEVVADEVVRQAMSSVSDKPAEYSYRLWLYSLGRRELERRIGELRQGARTNVPVEALAPEAPIEIGTGLTALEEPLALDEQPVVSAGMQMADSHILPPDVEASEKDLVDHLRHLAQQWPRWDQRIFELHFLEGFEPEEIAMLEKIRTSQANILIRQVQGRLREALSEAVNHRARRPTFLTRQKPDARRNLAAAGHLS